MKTLTDKILEEFEKEIRKLLPKDYYAGKLAGIEALKSFLTTALTRQKEKILEEIKKLDDWRQCNDCFDEDHCKGIKLSCECKCVPNREKRIRSRDSETNDVLKKVKQIINELK